MNIPALLYHERATPVMLVKPVSIQIPQEVSFMITSLKKDEVTETLEATLRARGKKSCRVPA
jgi:hypothetical protein